MAAPEQDPATSLRDALLADHHRIDDLLARVLVAIEALDSERMAAEWADFDRALSAHLDAEDRYLIPALSVTKPRVARAVLQEHRHVRGRARELGNAMKTGVLRAGTVRGFVDELSAHARHETAVLYEWAEDEIDEPDREAVLRAITSSSRPASDRSSPKS
jgi:hemerythrin-like domain-containing protein